MAFSYHRRKRKKREERQQKERTKAEENELRKQIYAPEDEAAQKEKAAKSAAEMAEDRRKGREEGRRYAEELFSRDIEGLTPAQRRSYEEQGKRQISRDVQGAQRQLAAQQGKRGLRGGAAYAQQANLARASAEAQRQLQGDISSMDADLALKRLAAMFNIEQGEAAQKQLDRQLSVDEQRAEAERRRQRYLQQQYDRLFSRI